MHAAPVLPPPVDPGGGDGGVGPGAAEQPIDMYLFLLFIVALVIILGYNYKLKKNIQT